MKRGFDVLRDKSLNRSIAFGRKDRDRLGLRGLLPYSVATERQMVARLMANLDRLPRDIDRYMLLSSVQERNERLFYRTVIEHIDRILPLIYTPTVPWRGNSAALRTFGSWKLAVVYGVLPTR